MYRRLLALLRYDHACVPSKSGSDHFCQVCGSPCHC